MDVQHGQRERGEGIRLPARQHSENWQAEAAVLAIKSDGRLTQVQWRKLSAGFGQAVRGEV